MFSDDCVHDKHGDHFSVLIWLWLDYYKKWFSWAQLFENIKNPAARERLGIIFT